MSRQRALLLAIGLLTGIYTEAIAQTNWALLSATLDSRNRRELQVTGQPGGICSLQTTTNLAFWSSLRLITNGEEVIRVLDETEAGLPAKFYRVMPVGDLAGILAEEYCARAGIVSPLGRAGIKEFLQGLQTLGLLTNLADFAFLAAGQNTASGDPVALRSSGKIVGNVNRLRGGFHLPNFADESSTNWFYFTNLPPTSGDRTLIVWGSQDVYGSRHAGGFGGHLFQITAPGGGPYEYVPAAGLYHSGGGLLVFTFNGATQVIAPNELLAFVNDNAIFCLSLSLSATGNIARLTEPNVERVTATPTVMPPSPAVLRFGATVFQAANYGSNCWNGLVRAWAYFDRALSAAEVDAVDALLPRIGVIVNGDSKSLFNNGYSPYWVQAPQNWGLMSILTNSSIANAVSRLNSPGASFEERWWIDAANFRTNQTYPMLLYSIRGGLHDCDDSLTTIGFTNGWTAVTNLWASVRSHGMRAVAFTLDPVRQFTTPNSNNVTWWNALVRTNHGLYDYLADVEKVYRETFSDSYTSNTTLYSDGVHETPWGMAFCGTGAVAITVAPSLGYETLPELKTPLPATRKEVGKLSRASEPRLGQ